MIGCTEVDEEAMQVRVEDLRKVLDNSRRMGDKGRVLIRTRTIDLEVSDIEFDERDNLIVYSDDRLYPDRRVLS